MSKYATYPEKAKAVAPHSSTLAWRIPWTEEPRRLQSMRLQRVRHNWATSLSLFTFTHWRRKCNPLQYSCLENPRDGGAWWAAVCEVAQSRTWLKRLSSRSSILPTSSAVKNLPANAGDAGSVPESGRSPGGGNGNPLQYSCLGNLKDRRAWWAIVHGGVTKDQTWLSNYSIGI